MQMIPFLLRSPPPNFSPRAQTLPAAIDVKRASASPAQPDSTWGEEGTLKGPVTQGLLGGLWNVETLGAGRIAGKTFGRTA